MQAFWDQFSEVLSGYFPKLLGALAILVVGWLVALIISAIVRRILRRTTLDNRIAAGILGEDRAKAIEVEKWVGKGVYYIVLIFVLIAFLQALNLTITAEPLNRLLIQLSEFFPRLIGGALLLATAWVAAALLRKIVSGVLHTARLDERLGGQIGLEEEKRPPLSKTISDAVYWLVFLLFLPAILGALALEGLLEPVAGMTDRILGFLPNLFAAGLILAVGWFIARIVQRIVTNLLAAVGTDRVSEKAGISTVLGKQRLSGLVGLVVYVLILIPVLITSLNALALEAITRPATGMLGTVMDAIPRIFAAVLLLGLAYVVARLLAGLIANLLAGAGFNTILAKIGLGTEQFREDRTPSTVVGYLVLVIIMLFAAIEASRLLGFATLADLVAGFTVFVGQVILGLAVFGVGLYLANLVSQTVLSSSAPQAGLLALVSRISILVLAGAIALRQMGLADEIINLAFGIGFGAVAVAGALAFGIGGRELAARKLQGWFGSMEREP
jgi:hypothetical protein